MNVMGGNRKQRVDEENEKSFEIKEQNELFTA
jgi:hypothetical protein